MALRPLPPKQDSPRPATANKQFAIEQWDGSKTGEKIILYGETGMGKTTLASMAPNPVFIGLDDGGRKLHHPKTGELLRHIPSVNTFEDVRGALGACLDLDCQTVVVDTGTLFQRFAEQFVLRTVIARNAKGQPGLKPDHIEDYGWGKGYKHLWDAMRLPLLDFDKLIEAGKNVIVICQLICNKHTTDIGQEYLKEGPDLYHSEKWSVLKMWCQWADHIFRIRHQQTIVPEGKKRALGDSTHVIDTRGDNAFYAKSRTLEESIISFSTKDDNSLWQLLFKGN
jgi:hypothetical protein